MANINRGRVSVSLGAHWRDYLTRPPVGVAMLGTVTRKGETRALGRGLGGEYFALADGTRPEPLPALKVQSAIAALALAGEPESDPINGPVGDFSGPGR